MRDANLWSVRGRASAKREARQARAKEKKKKSARFRIGESSWRRGDRAGSGEARRTSLAFIRIRSRRAPHVGQSDASGNASAGRSHTQIHKIEGEKLFPIWRTKLFWNFTDIFEDERVSFPQKVSDHVTSRSLSTAPGTRHDPCFWSSQGSSSTLVVVSHKARGLFTLETHVSSLAQLGFRDRTK